MRTLIFTALCVMAGAVWADSGSAVVKVYSLDVQQRIQNLELINVTAEKPADESAAPPDPELQAILDEVDAIETEE